MKNVYNDIDLENDTVESVEEEVALPQFKKPEAKKRRRVEYDDKGRVREDRSMRWMKLVALFGFIILVSVYAFHTCGAQIFGVK